MILGLLACEPGPPDSAAPVSTPSCDSLLPIVDEPVEGLRFDGDAPQSLLLVVNDTFRHDVVQFYGGDRVTMPCLQSRADHVVRFDNAYATGNWTGITTASILTGLFPEHHGLLRVDSQSGAPEIDVPVTAPTFAGHFASLGHSTLQVSGNGWISEESGLMAGFESVKANPGEEGQTDASDIAPEVRAWLNALAADKPFFIHFQPVDNHDPYLPLSQYADRFIDTADYPWPPTRDGQRELTTAYPDMSEADKALAREWFAGLYAAETLAVDAEVEATLATLAATGRLDDTLLVVMGDHGESLDDDRSDYFGHGSSLREELVHVPLLAYHPRLQPGAVAGIVRGIDVLPTALAAMGLPALDGIDGAAGGAAMAYGGWWRNDDQPLRTEAVYAVSGRLKLVRSCAGGESAYDLEADPTEMAPVSELSQLAGAEALSAALDAQVTALQEGSTRIDTCVFR
ncbi:MAG: sulfatase-like hydrolase/transferase [Deltaproteobacteria bacterium]|nr:sulfatase-like hydrolase/transferase [Deltaproteobacteria bacterium]